MHSSSQAQTVPHVPLGLPRLPDAGSTPSFELLRSWLRDCNERHGEKQLDCISSRSQKYLPKRLLAVGSGANDNHSYIVDTKDIETPGDIEYLALSHPWGKTSSDNPHFVSNVDNIDQHRQRIADADLPQNFKDAVIVARKLGVPYLWIDALCILQATPNDTGDFEQEAGSMEDVFSSAYSVLAASSATEMKSGFLHREGLISRKERKATAINAGEPGDRVFICDSPDDFQHDVNESPLSERAWVLQERALARRTMFFTDNQIYWECSGGFRCETMSKLAKYVLRQLKVADGSS